MYFSLLTSIKFKSLNVKSPTIARDFMSLRVYVRSPVFCSCPSSPLQHEAFPKRTRLLRSQFSNPVRFPFLELCQRTYPRPRNFRTIPNTPVLRFWFYCRGLSLWLFPKVEEHLLAAMHDCYSTCPYLEAVSYSGVRTRSAVVTEDSLNIQCWFTHMKF